MKSELVFLLLLSMGCANPADEEITYTKHIAPILQENCLKCHYEEGPGPFPLLTFEQVAPKAKLLVHVTSNRLMPPWPADPEFSHFANETYLEQSEIALIQKWVDKGCKPGDTAKFPKEQELKQQWKVRNPDLIVKLPKPIKVPGTNEDLFLVMKIPFDLPQDTFIRAIEFVPGKNRLVHHMNAHIVQFDPKKKKQNDKGLWYINQDQSKSQEIHKQLGLLHDDGSYPTLTPSVCNYLPGSQFGFYPDEVGGIKVGKRNAFYLNDLHYGPSPIEETDSSYFRIYFAAKPPARPVSEFQIGTLGLAPVEPSLVIPPNSIKTFHIRFTVPQDISVLTLVPHMHLLGKRYLAYALKPDGDTLPLIRIPRWDFRWQFFYQPPALLKIPRNSVIVVEGEFDNTRSNPNNPFDPPREIAEREGSMKTTDEMFQLIVTYVPWKQGDDKIRVK